MSLKHAKGGNRPLPPAGNHVARLCQFVDLGTTNDPKYGGDTHKVRITWELSEEFRDFGKGEQEPFLISRIVTFSSAPKANLRKVLEGMKGSGFSVKELEALDQTIKALVGQPCMLNVVHVQSGDTTFANVEGVAPIPAKLVKNVPALHNEAIFFDTDMGPESRAFLLLPDFLKNQISKCQEWNQPEEDNTDQLHLKLG
jgi:hypothetical protein